MLAGVWGVSRGEGIASALRSQGRGFIMGTPLVGGGLSMFTDPKGVQWAAIVGWSSIFIFRRKGDPTEWTSHTEDAEYPDLVNEVVELPNSEGYDAVDIDGDGQALIVVARDASSRHVYSWSSSDGGNIWLGPYPMSELE